MKFTIILGFISRMVSSHELKVKSEDLQKCPDQTSCVTDKEHCNSLPKSQDPRTQVNLTCYYEPSDSLAGQVSCSWSPASPGSSLVFTPLSGKLISCPGILWFYGAVNVTVRVHSQLEGVVRYSVPHSFSLSRIVRGPDVVFSGSTSSTLNLSWTPNRWWGVCKVRYTAESGPRTPQEKQVEVGPGKEVVYTLQELLPFTLYRAMVACKPTIPDSSSWSFWSAEVKGHTLETAPSEAPEVCYHLERSRGSPGAPPLLRLWLMWTELNVCEAGGHIKGYQVSYNSSTNKLKQAQTTVNVTGQTALLVVKEESSRVTVKAFNSVGFGPMRTLNTEPHQPLSLPRNLWAFSLFPDHVGFLVQWEMDSVPHTPPTTLGQPAYQGASSPALPVSQFAVEWRIEGRDSPSGWTRVDNTSAVIQGDLDPEQIYNITVHPVRAPLCGPVRYIAASLQHGALLEVISLRAVDVNKTTITAQWLWEKKTSSIRVDRYNAVLMCKCDSEDQVLLLLPDQSQHTFQNLIPNMEYSLLLLADNNTRGTHIFRTPSDVSTATLVSCGILLVVTIFFCFLSRAVYKHYFMSMVSSPRGSSIGLWLMDKHKQVLVRNILTIEDFRVTDLLGDKHPIKVAAGEQIHLKGSQYTDPHTADLGKLLPSQEYVVTAQVVAVSAVYTNNSALFQSSDYIANSPVAMEAFSGKTQPLVQHDHHHHHHHSQCAFLQEEEVTAQLGRFYTPEVVNLCLGKGLDLPGGPPMVCESNYVLLPSFFQGTGTEVQ